MSSPFIGGDSYDNMTYFDEFILDEERSWKITDCCLEIKDASHICTYRHPSNKNIIVSLRSTFHPKILEVLDQSGDEGRL